MIDTIVRHHGQHQRNLYTGAIGLLRQNITVLVFRTFVLFVHMLATRLQKVACAFYFIAVVEPFSATTRRVSIECQAIAQALRYKLTCFIKL